MQKLLDKLLLEKFVCLMSLFLDSASCPAPQMKRDNRDNFGDNFPYVSINSYSRNPSSEPFRQNDSNKRYGTPERIFPFRLFIRID